MGGKTTVIEGNRISNFQLNNSAYGLPVPLVLGTSRIAGNIIDWVDFTTITHTETQSSGKGGGGSKTVTKSYTYTVAAIVGLCEGQVNGIGQIWKDKDVLNAAKLSIDVFTGAYGQSSWNYMASKHPERALSYSGLCYVAGTWDLGSSGSLPNLNFEVRGILLPGDGTDVNPAEAVKYIITDSLNGVGFGLGSLEAKTWQQFKDYAAAAGLLVSLPLTERRKAFEIIRDICECANADFFWSQNKLKFVVKADEQIGNYTPNKTPWYELTADDFLPFGDGSLVKFSRKNSADAFNCVSVEFTNRANGYQKEQATYMVTADIARRGMRQMPKKALPYLHTKERAEYVARTLAQESLFIRVKYTFKLGWTHCLLEPGDFVTLTDESIGLTAEPVIIEEIIETADGELECTAYGRPTGVYNPPVYDTHHADRPAIDYGISPGTINQPYIFCPPPDELNGLTACVAVSGQTANWGGAGVWLSSDGMGYKWVGEVEAPSVYGYLTEALTVSGTTVKVKLYGGQLLSGSQEIKLFLDGEVIGYKTAQLTGDKAYTLTEVKRGLDFSTPKAHAINAKTAKLDGLFRYAFVSADIGKKIYLKLTSYNIFGVAEESLEDVGGFSATLTSDAPPDVSGITLEEDTFILRDGTVLSDIAVSFAAPGYPLLGSYDIYYELNANSQYNLAGQTTAHTFKIKSLPQAKTVRVKVVTVNKFGVCSAGTVSNPYTIVGKSNPPPDVKNLKVSIDTANRANVILTWDAIDEETTPDLNGYEVRLGDTWDLAKVLTPVPLYAESFIYKASKEGSHNFLVKAKDNSRIYSVLPAYAIIAVTLTPDTPKNFAIQQNPQDRTQINLTWEKSPGADIAGYEIRLNGTSWQTAAYLDFTREIRYLYKASASGAYTFHLAAKTIEGYYSNETIISVTIFLEAYDVTGFTAAQSIENRTKVKLFWDKPLSLDVAYFEIREGASWENGAVVNNRVTDITYEVTVNSERAYRWWIKAVTAGGKYSLSAAMVEGIFDLNPSPVKNIVIKQNPLDRSQLFISWDRNNESDFQSTEVRHGYTWATAQIIADTKEKQITYSPQNSGDFKVLIKNKNMANFYSDEAFASFYAGLEPAAVAGFQVLQNGEFIQFYWNVAAEPDVVSYEIREGLGWDYGTVIETGITGTNYKTKVDFEKMYVYWIKALNRAGKYSQTAVGCQITAANLPPKNVILQYDELTRKNGTQTNVEFGTSSINWSNLGGKWSDYFNTKFSQVGGKVVLRLKKQAGNNYYASGEYTVQTVDVGQVVTCNLSSLFSSTVNLRGVGSAALQISTSRDNVTWTAWQNFKPAQYTFRYLKYKAILSTNDLSKTPEITQLTIVLDVDDDNRSGSANIAVGGSTVSLNVSGKQGYYTVPVVIPMAIGANKFAQIISITKNDFKVTVLDRAGSDVGGQINWTSYGY